MDSPRPSSRYPGGRPGRKQRRIRERVGAYRASRRELRRPLPREAVPSFFTLMNLFAGFVAITQAFNGHFQQACWLIVLAAFFDVLDGMMARLTRSSSLFGVELDSLCDIVSFGVAPSLLVYTYGLRDLGVLGLTVASLPAICGAVRLARFNVSFDGEKRDYFVGLPIPGQALIMVALIMNFDSLWFERFSVNDQTLLIPIVFVLSFFMVSTIPFDAFPKPTPEYFRKHPKKTLLYVVGLLLLITLQQIGLLIALACYLLFGVGTAIYNLIQVVLNFPVDGEEAAPRED